MIGYLSGLYLGNDDSNVLIDCNGVGYSVLVSPRISSASKIGTVLKLYIHTNLRENALELFGFETLWEKKVFQLLTSVSGVGPKTGISILSGLDAETILSAIVREDRATLTSAPGIGKKTAERLMVEIGDKARHMLSDRPKVPGTPGSAIASEEKDSRTKAASSAKKIPQQGASADPVLSGIDLTDLWNEAIEALVNLGYREGDAILAVKTASSKTLESGASLSVEKLIMSSLQLMSKGL